MILAPYRNPPYRTPTPKNRKQSNPNNNNNNNNKIGNPEHPASTPLAPPPKISVPHHPSPKRKRADSAAAPTATATSPSTSTPASLHVHIPAVRNTRTEDAMPESGANSPRSKVAERLSGLELSPTESPRGQSPRKKLKGEDEGEREIAESPRGSLEAEMMEIAETPNAYGGGIASLPSSSLPLRREDSLVGDTAPSCRQREENPVKRLSSSSSSSSSPFSPSSSSPPPPPPPPRRSISTEAMAIDTPLPLDSGYDQAALTWQDSEITGHLIDATSADDDGEGINGIGFKPTSAMTYARSQRRKQQVSEWKAREAREARQKRLERRRGGSRERGAGEAGGNGRRTVRFAGAV